MSSLTVGYVEISNSYCIPFLLSVHHIQRSLVCSSQFIAILSCICVKIPGKRKWNCFLQDIWGPEFEKEWKWNQRGFQSDFGISSFFDRCLKQSWRVHYFRSSCLFDSTTIVSKLSSFFLVCSVWGWKQAEKMCDIT